MVMLSVAQPANRHLQYLSSRTIFQGENWINILKHFFKNLLKKIYMFIGTPLI